MKLNNLRKQKFLEDAIIIYEVDREHLVFPNIDISKPFKVSMNSLDLITLYPKDEYHITLVGNSIAGKILQKFSTPKLCSLNRQMRFFLLDFFIDISPMEDEIYVVQKTYNRDLGSGTYERYSIIQRYRFNNKMKFLNTFERIYSGIKIDPLVHITLMTGTNAPEEHNSYNGIGIENLSELRRYAIKKLNQFSETQKSSV